VLWNANRSDKLKVAVNVSALQLYFSDLSEVVRGALRRTGLPAHLLELELTESILLRDTDKCVRDLIALRKTGVTIAIDDFGAGYSCLSYLQTLPVDVLKIDRSFFMQEREGRSNAAVLRAITSLAHGLGLRVVAEGIERASQMPALRDLRVDLIQGFLFGKPRPLADSEQV
jgi:EAL domain-containing protein (putative c-di-GMP-specific phosphodiesterase class I)